MILVTGASGFLGGAILRELSARGSLAGASSAVAAAEDLRGLVRTKTTETAALPSETVVGDVLVPETLRRPFAGARVVYHAAGMLGQASVPEGAYHQLHVEGTANVLRAARAAGVARVVYVSSPGVLGPVPQGLATEDAPYNPTNAYERSKAAGERRALSLAVELGLDLVVVRPEFVYGPWDRHVLRLFEAIRRRRFVFLGDGRALCHPTYVDDAVRGMVDAGERGTPGRIYHFAGPRPVSIRELAVAFAGAMGISAPWIRLPQGAARMAAAVLDELTRGTSIRAPLTKSAVDFFTSDRQFSWQRAKDELGWEPKVSLEDGANRAVRWYRERGWLQ